MNGFVLQCFLLYFCACRDLLVDIGFGENVLPMFVRVVGVSCCGGAWLYAGGNAVARALIAFSCKWTRAGVGIMCHIWRDGVWVCWYTSY